MRVSVLGDVSSWLPMFGEWFRYMKFNKSLIYAGLFNGKCLSGTCVDDSARKSVQPSRGLQMLASRIGMSARPMPSSLAVKQELWVYLFVHFELLKYGSVFFPAFLNHSSCPVSLVVFWNYGSAAPPLMGHTGRASTAHTGVFNPGYLDRKF